VLTAPGPEPVASQLPDGNNARAKMKIVSQIIHLDGELVEEAKMLRSCAFRALLPAMRAILVEAPPHPPGETTSKSVLPP
jgi:hypothetical protein